MIRSGDLQNSNCDEKSGVDGKNADSASKIEPFKIESPTLCRFPQHQGSDQKSTGDKETPNSQISYEKPIQRGKPIRGHIVVPFRMMAQDKNDTERAPAVEGG